MNENIMLNPGTMLNNGAYRVEQPITHGRFGNLYLVINTATQELQAMKELFIRGITTRESDFVTANEGEHLYRWCREDFKREIGLLQILRNARHIVRLRDTFEDYGTFYYVMDFIRGYSLAEWLKQESNPLTEWQVRRVLQQVLQALRDMHALYIYHLDIKPGNIMLDKLDSVYIVDFGTAQQAVKGRLHTSYYTPRFAPVEQLNQDLEHYGPWTDIYALGCTTYALLTQRMPPSRGNIGMNNNAFLFQQYISHPMQELVKWMMQPSYKARPTIDDIENVLQQIDG